MWYKVKGLQNGRVLTTDQKVTRSSRVGCTPHSQGKHATCLLNYLRGEARSRHIPVQPQKSYPIYEKRHASGNVGYRVDMGVLNDKRVFKSFQTKEAAERFQLKCRETDARNKPIELHDLSEIVRHEVHAALAKLKAHNASITTAVDYFLKHARPARANTRISEVIAEFLKVKKKSGKSSKYLKSAMDSFFLPFQTYFEDAVLTDVSSADCQNYIYRSKNWGATTQRSHIRHLSVLFNFGIKNGFASLNPFEAIEIPTKPESNAGKKVATVEQVISVLQYAFKGGYHAECAALVLIMFCGVRTEEVAALTWADVKLDANRPEVVLNKTKNTLRRVNPIPKNAIEWLTKLRGKGKIVDESYKSRLRRIKKLSKSGFKQNTARICFASYHVALHRDGAKTAYLLGHQNPTLLYNTYRAVVSHDDAKRYWKITPDYTGEDSLPTVSEEEATKARFKAIAHVISKSS